MAKIVMDSTPPHAEISVAEKRVVHLMATKRGHDPVGVKMLADVRKHLRDAAEQLQKFDRRSGDKS